MKKARSKLILLPLSALFLVFTSCVKEGEDLGQLLSNAAFNTLIGMGTVFIVLMIICFIIYLFKFIHLAEEKAAKKAAAVPAQVTEGKTATQEEPGQTEDLTDDTELAAVIAAAIAAYEGTSSDGIIVRSIRRVGERKLEKARG